jgi:hypothetical protein
MDFYCYLKHSSDFEPKDCAEYFRKNGLEVVIDSDYTDDSLEIAIKDSKTGKCCVFESNKMDRSEYKQLLENFPKYEAALKKLNARADISTKNDSDRALALTLLSYLHNKHKAYILDDYNKRPLGTKKLKELREKSIANYQSGKQLSFKEFAAKYHLAEIAFSLILLVGYFIFDHYVSYSTDMFFFLIVIGLIVYWIHG